MKKRMKSAPSCTLVLTRHRIVIQRHFLINFLQHIFEVIYITFHPEWFFFSFSTITDRVIFTIRNYTCSVLSWSISTKHHYQQTERFLSLTTNRVIFNFNFGTNSPLRQHFWQIVHTGSLAHDLTRRWNRIKMSSHNKGHRNHPISFQSKEAITGWILYATRNQPTQGLVYDTSSLGELLLQLYLLTKDPTF